MVTIGPSFDLRRWRGAFRLAGLVAVVVLLAGTACTGGGSDDDDAGSADTDGATLDVAGVLGDAADAGSASYRGELRVTDPALDEPAVLGFTGRYDDSVPANTITLDAGPFVTSDAVADDLALPAGLESAFADPIDGTVIGDDAWIRAALLEALTGTPGAWASISRGQLEAVAAGFGVQALIVSPAEPLRWLATGEASVSGAGPEPVDGADADRWRATYDADAIRAGLPETDVAGFDAAFGTEPGTQIAADLWVDAATGELVRFEMPLTGSTLGGPEAVSTLSMTLSELSSAAPVEAPLPADVIDGAAIFSLLGF